MAHLGQVAAAAIAARCHRSLLPGTERPNGPTHGCPLSEAMLVQGWAWAGRTGGCAGGPDCHRYGQGPACGRPLTEAHRGLGVSCRMSKRIPEIQRGRGSIPRAGVSRRQRPPGMSTVAAACAAFRAAQHPAACSRQARRHAAAARRGLAPCWGDGRMAAQTRAYRLTIVTAGN
jgi:hypothetical protein